MTASFMLLIFASAIIFFFFFQAEDGIRDGRVTGVQTCAPSDLLARATNDADIWQKVVELDTLDEEAARNLMKTLIERGDAAGATRVYKRLVDALRRELDVEPEPETIALASKAKKK